jgi:hypothetical protein
MSTEFYDNHGKPTIEKDPNARLDYPINFADWLSSTDLLDSFTYTVNHSSSVNVYDSYLSVDRKSVILWVEGGVLNEKPSITVRITTVDGRTDDRTIYFKMKEQ